VKVGRKPHKTPNHLPINKGKHAGNFHKYGEEKTLKDPRKNQPR
jgi:hypothetical protein